MFRCIFALFFFRLFVETERVAVCGFFHMHEKRRPLFSPFPLIPMRFAGVRGTVASYFFSRFDPVQAQVLDFSPECAPELPSLIESPGLFVSFMSPPDFCVCCVIASSPCDLCFGRPGVFRARVPLRPLFLFFTRALSWFHWFPLPVFPPASGEDPCRRMPSHRLPRGFQPT